MRIAVVHSFYGSAAPSGENLVVAAQAEALRRAGHDVHLVTAATDDLADQPLYALRSATTVATGRGRSPLGRLRELAPDLVHVHNLFPNFGRAWVSSWRGPLVTSLHNYRPLCANGLLYREGALCTRCPDGDRWAGLRGGCYRESRA
ncbi:glycosyltransferase, partial [Streptomyces sp. T-3]|nr:glycosyltransferase [Streptomyces sp. T-3]